jgi:hypothetical protein
MLLLHHILAMHEEGDWVLLPDAWLAQARRAHLTLAGNMQELSSAVMLLRYNSAFPAVQPHTSACLKHGMLKHATTPSHACAAVMMLAGGPPGPSCCWCVAA